MKRIIFCISLFAFYGSQAQQINPVPDYVFSNKMSVGRNAVTDTAAYFSIGPRYGAIRGMMPPMVTDTASMSATKRNGLLIFSIQKNKYLYWDSVGSKWAEMAGTAGSAITGSGVAGYMPEFTTSTNLDTTRLYHSAGRFAIGSTTTTNGVFNVYGGQSYFDTSLKVGSQTLLADEGKNEVYVNTTSDAGAYALQVAGSIYNTTGAVFAHTSGSVGIGTVNPAYTLDVSGTMRVRTGTFFQESSGNAFFDQVPNSTNAAIIRQTRGSQIWWTGVGANSNENWNVYDATAAAFRLTLNTAGELLIGTTTDAGAYALQVNGTTYTLGLTMPGGGYSLVYGTSNANTRITGDNSGGANTYIEMRTNGANRLRIQEDGEILLNNISDAGAYTFQVAGAIYNTTTITTGAPSGGTAKPFKIGAAATVSPTSPNRTIEIEIDGTTYYLHAKTTND